MVILAIILSGMTFYLFQNFALGEVMRGLGMIFVFFSGLMALLRWRESFNIQKYFGQFVRDGQYILATALFFIIIPVVLSLALLFKIFITYIFPENHSILSLWLGFFGLILMLVSLSGFFRGRNP